MIFYKFKHSLLKRRRAKIVDSTAREIYGNRVRSRVCGVCTKEDKILLVNHAGLYGHDFWAPPGGGIEFGQAATSNLVREFREETGLDISVGDFLFACEFIGQPLHAIELFFNVQITGGTLVQGSDPEMSNGKQLIHAVKFMTWAELKSLPAGHKHGVFSLARPVERIGDLRGYHRI